MKSKSFPKQVAAYSDSFAKDFVPTVLNLARVASMEAAYSKWTERAIVAAPRENRNCARDLQSKQKRKPNVAHRESRRSVTGK